ncbi:MAG: hypothetical protein A2355_04935, partial [Spirochaetes bacterium RIFOXYB1_FULL_32_8]
EKIINILNTVLNSLHTLFNSIKTKFHFSDFIISVKNIVHKFKIKCIFWFETIKEINIKKVHTRLPYTLYQMLFLNFLNWYLLAQGFGILLIVIADLFGKLDSYMTNNMSIPNILLMTVLLFPKAIWFTMPFVIMFGIIMAISSLYQSNELIAVFTSGISYTKFTMPIILFSVFLSISMIFIDSYGVVHAMRYRDKLFQKLTSQKTDDYTNITVKSEKEGYFWHVNDFDPIRNRLDKIICFKIDVNYRMVERINAEYGVYTKNGWIFYTGMIREWNIDGTLKEDVKFNRKIFNLPENPSVFKSSGYEIETMNINEAGERIKLLKRLNIEHKKEMTDYYKKFSFPFILIIFSIFAIGVSTISKIYILIIALFLSIAQAIVYYIAQFLLLDNLAYTGIVSPFFGAWFTFFLFLPVAVILIAKAKT